MKTAFHAGTRLSAGIFKAFYHHTTTSVKKKEAAQAASASFVKLRSMIFHPLADLCLCQTQNVRSGVGRGFTAGYIQKIQTGGSLVQALLVAGRITEEAAGIFLDQCGGIGVIFLFADDFLQGWTSFPYVRCRYYIVICSENQGFFTKTPVFQE